MRRVYAESLIKYDFYIKNMPKDEIKGLLEYQQDKIQSFMYRGKPPKDKSHPDVEKYLNEIYCEYSRVMNKIIFDKHLYKKGTEIIVKELILPPKETPKKSPFFGLISVPFYNFPEKFATFCFNTLNIKVETIQTLEEALKYSVEIEEGDVFNNKYVEVMKKEKFKSVHESYITKTSYFLRETWTAKLKEIIRTKFDKTGKGWFSIHETNYEAYILGKIKKLLTLIKLKMESTVLQLFKNSFQNFHDTIINMTPIEVKVISPLKVENKYKPHPFLNIEIPKNPIFTIELRMPQGSTFPVYDSDPKVFVNLCLNLFDKGIEEFTKISVLEERLFPIFFKGQSFLKIPLRPKEKPMLPTKLSELADENEWLWSLYKNLENHLEKAILPLEDYLNTYKEFEDEYLKNPDLIIKNIKDDDHLSTPKELKILADTHIELGKKILNSIPESIIVSCFKVECADVRSKLSEKHKIISKALIDFIADKFRSQTEKLISRFEEIKGKIRKLPKSIEELTEIKDYMAAVINELDKIKVDINSMMETYEITQTFHYKFSPEEIRKQWVTYQGPKTLFELIEQQTLFLDREKEKFALQMKVNQDELLEKAMEIEKIVSKFSQYQNIDDYPSVSSTAMSIMEKLKAYQEEARIFNSRELMLGKEQTDYFQIKQMVKDFTPFYNLWTITNLWKKSHQDWLTCDWEKLDAINLEETVEKSIKTMATVNRHFRDKEMPNILKMSEKIKSEIEEFNPIVPLAVALRTVGMRDRHWEAISEKVGFKVKPDSKFTLSKALDLGLLNHLKECSNIAETLNNLVQARNMELNLI